MSTFALKIGGDPPTPRATHSPDENELNFLDEEDESDSAEQSLIDKKLEVSILTQQIQDLVAAHQLALKKFEDQKGDAAKVAAEKLEQEEAELEKLRVAKSQLVAAIQADTQRAQDAYQRDARKLAEDLQALRIQSQQEKSKREQEVQTLGAKLELLKTNIEEEEKRLEEFKKQTTEGATESGKVKLDMEKIKGDLGRLRREQEESKVALRRAKQAQERVANETLERQKEIAAKEQELKQRERALEKGQSQVEHSLSQLGWLRREQDNISFMDSRYFRAPLANAVKKAIEMEREKPLAEVRQFWRDLIAREFAGSASIQRAVLRLSTAALEGTNLPSIPEKFTFAWLWTLRNLAVFLVLARSGIHRIEGVLQGTKKAFQLDLIKNGSLARFLIEKDVPSALVAAIVLAEYDSFSILNAGNRALDHSFLGPRSPAALRAKFTNVVCDGGTQEVFALFNDGYAESTLNFPRPSKAHAVIGPKKHVFETWHTKTGGLTGALTFRYQQAENGPGCDVDVRFDLLHVNEEDLFNGAFQLPQQSFGNVSDLLSAQQWIASAALPARQYMIPGLVKLYADNNAFQAAFALCFVKNQNDGAELVEKFRGSFFNSKLLDAVLAEIRLDRRQPSSDALFHQGVLLGGQWRRLLHTHLSLALENLSLGDRPTVPLEKKKKKKKVLPFSPKEEDFRERVRVAVKRTMGMYFMELELASLRAQMEDRAAPFARAEHILEKLELELDQYFAGLRSALAAAATFQALEGRKQLAHERAREILLLDRIREEIMDELTPVINTFKSSYQMKRILNEEEDPDVEADSQESTEYISRMVRMLKEVPEDPFWETLDTEEAASRKRADELLDKLRRGELVHPFLVHVGSGTAHNCIRCERSATLVFGLNRTLGLAFCSQDCFH
jgi:hypothetical protein